MNLINLVCPGYVGIYEMIGCTLYVLSASGESFDVTVNYGDGEIDRFNNINTAKSFKLNKIYHQDNYFEIKVNVKDSDLSISVGIFVLSKTFYI